MEVREQRPDGEPVSILIQELWNELVARYVGAAVTQEGQGARDDLELHELTPPDGTFLVAYEAGAAVGCGGVRRYDATTGEIKRMYVRPDARGRGISRALLKELEAAAERIGYLALVLETGLRQPEAIGLYESAGYARIANYGFFRDEPVSVCYRKDL